MASRKHGKELTAHQTARDFTGLPVVGEGKYARKMRRNPGWLDRGPNGHSLVAQGSFPMIGDCCQGGRADTPPELRKSPAVGMHRHC